MATRTDLEAMITSGEQILWRGKPQKKCFIFESIFNPMFPFALLWAIIDFSIIGTMFNSNVTNNVEKNQLLFFLVFFLFHLMPVWIYLGGVILSVRKYRNTEYIITDKGIYLSGGTFTYNCQMKPFAELSNVTIHRGIFDQLFGVGDVVVGSGDLMNYSSSNSRSSHIIGLTIKDISEYQQVFSMVKQLQTDIYSDTMYPNDLRPAENHGYQTQYKGKM